MTDQENRRPERQAENPGDFEIDPLDIDPSCLPGVRPIPKALNNYIFSKLEPGEYYAKSSTRLLGPFIQEPSESQLPTDEAFVIMRRMGTLPNGGIAFQKVRQI
ncbi:unnamed protein product, partial [Mesorhabditis spiculigera]